MKKLLGLSVVLIAAPFTQAADIEAGRARVATVCAACHGAAGVSVSETIPNLAAQRAGYIEAQLKALKEGTRKNAIMNAIAAQLSLEEIGNVAAYFASLPGAGAAAKSDFLPNLARTGVKFPEGYKETFTMYHTVNNATTKQVRYYYANKSAAQAAKDGKPLPDGSVLLVEINSAKLDAEKKPIAGADGFFVPDQTTGYTAMEREAGWGAEVPEMLRNENWNYAVFTTAKQHRPGVNQAECLACHKPLDKASYTFTLKQLAEAAAK
jgi:cytochrome c553